MKNQFKDISFSKFQGAGNDFIMIDNRTGAVKNIQKKDIISLCNRKTGIGSDGLILMNSSTENDFDCDYYNSDGSQSFCGNGARCAVAFARMLGIARETYTFSAIDGFHEAFFEGELVNLEMKNVNDIEFSNGDFILNTGSPHFVRLVHDVNSLNVKEEGKEIRNSTRFKKEGINVNFIQEIEACSFYIRTFERGVEDETMACGTGITASALVLAAKNGLRGKHRITAKTSFYSLNIEFNRVKETSFEQIRLIGPAEFVFSGNVTFPI